jgi:hypothetical protein
MKLKLALTAGVFSVLALASIPQVTSAATGPYSPIPGVMTSGGVQIEQVQFGRCRYWAGVCSARWGRGNPRFFRCMAGHGC